MFENWTFGKKLGGGFALAGLVLALVAVVGHRSTGQLIENDRWVKHTHEVRLNIAEMLAQLTFAEASLRGYIIVGDMTFLGPFQDALTRMKADFEHVRTLTADNTVQQRRLQLLEPLLNARAGKFNQAAEARRNSGFEAASKLVTDGAELSDQIRNLAKEIDHDEDALLANRTAEAQASAEMTQDVMLWGCVLGVFMIAALGWFIGSSLTRQVGTAVQQVQSSSTELQASANQQAAGAKEQATAMSEITTTISELLATSRQIAESAQRVAQIAEQTASSARTGGNTVDGAHESISAIRRQVDSIVTHMLELGRKSQQIGAVLDIVSELAEQTNILAINATIEAAGAGDAGKRFAVVADEIRKLADRVTGSTKEIRTLIDDVRSAVNTTVMATETGSKAVDAGSKQFADVAAAFRQIAGLVSTTTEAAREIELSTKQQSTAVEQVNVAIANVAQATRETEASSEQTLKTASQLSLLSRDLLRIIRPGVTA
jgi:methyl-accepting chemotaxis protein